MHNLQYVFVDVFSHTNVYNNLCCCMSHSVPAQSQHYNKLAMHYMIQLYGLLHKLVVQMNIIIPNPFVLLRQKLPLQVHG